MSINRDQANTLKKLVKGEDLLFSDNNPKLGANLDLNGYDIPLSSSTQIALNLKADKGESYIKEETYTKEEVDNQISINIVSPDNIVLDLSEVSLTSTSLTDAFIEITNKFNGDINNLSTTIDDDLGNLDERFNNKMDTGFAYAKGEIDDKVLYLQSQIDLSPIGEILKIKKDIFFDIKF